MKKHEVHHASENEVEEYAALLELGQQAKVIFHDLANHFTSLSLTVKELEENLASEKERFRQYAKRSVETRSHIEYIARLLRSHLRREEERYYPSQTTSEILELYSERITKNNIQIEFKADRKTVWYAHKRDFIHIVTNLVGNAIESFKTTTKHKRVIRVSITHHNDRTELCVADTGCGIPPQNMSHIFTPGFTTKQTGHGIGLAAVKETIQKVFCGHINIQSSPQGTKIVVTFPKQNRKRNSPPVSNGHIDPILLSKSLERLSNRSVV